MRRNLLACRRPAWANTDAVTQAQSLADVDVTVVVVVIVDDHDQGITKPAMMSAQTVLADEKPKADD